MTCDAVRSTEYVPDSVSMMLMHHGIQIGDYHMGVGSGQPLQDREISLTLHFAEDVPESGALKHIWALCLDNLTNRCEADWHQNVAIIAL